MSDVKSTVLIPYCPFPCDTGGKVEMLKHVNVLRGLGQCKVLSASRKPVGCGWSNDHRVEFRDMGVQLSLREDECRLSMAQMAGIAYAAFFKSFGMDKAFGHSNPYHRYAFPVEWWKRHTDGVNFAVVNYSYWAWLPCACPKVVVLLDLWSDHMWEGADREIEDLSTADLVVVISKEEEKKLNERGIARTLWSPPAVNSLDLPMNDSVACIGSPNKFNLEGLRWLEKAAGNLQVRIYGGIASHVTNPCFEKIGRYEDTVTPYRDNGIILLPTAHGMGVQIKAIESLAYGRAIVARKGAMRGLPEGSGAWIEVGRPEEMVEAALALQSDGEAKRQLACRARNYYAAHLSSEEIKNKLIYAYHSLAGRAQCGSHCDS